MKSHLHYYINRILKCLCILFTFFSLNANAQEIFGDWVKTKVTFSNDIELKDESITKHQNLRFTFEKPNKLYRSFVFGDKGSSFPFEKDADLIQVKAASGSGRVMYIYQIIKLTNDELILVQNDENGLTDVNCLKYYFKREKVYQNQLPLKSADIISVANNDTIYRSSPKIYAKFLNEKTLNEFCKENIPLLESDIKTNDNFFSATFIIRKNGIVDSIHVWNNINSGFEKQFRKAINKTKNQWQPAELNNRKVDAQMNILFKFSSSAKSLSKINYFSNGKNALANLDYLGAIAYFDLLLKIDPNDYESILYKAICEIKIGRKTDYCEELEKVRISGRMQIDELIEKNCK